MSNGIKFFKTVPNVMHIGSNGNIGIGTKAPGEVLVGSWAEWCEIKNLAETNPTIKIALEKLMTIYHLSKDHGNSKT